MISFGTFINVACLVGPYLIPRAIAFYRSIKNRPAAQIRPAPPAVNRTLNILFVIVIVELLSTVVPTFQAPNIFTSTNSRLGISTSLLFRKVAELRPNGTLSPLDEALRSKFESEPSDIRLFYAAYGPYTVAECLFCQATDPSTFLYYHLPSIVMPHLVHIALLGFMTSSFFSGPEGARWRIWATIAGVALALWDVQRVYTYRWESNKNRRQLHEVDFFYWAAQTQRRLAFALCDALFGCTLWLTATNRWLVEPPAPAQRLAEHNRALGQGLSSVAALADLRNAVVRDPQLRAVTDEYWRLEARVMEEVENQPEVIQAKNLALSKIDPVRVDREAQAVVDGVFGPLLQQPDPSRGR